MYLCNFTYTYIITVVHFSWTTLKYTVCSLFSLLPEELNYHCRESDNETCQAILMSVRLTLASERYQFVFTDPIGQARIVTGEEEGTFSWITTNYLSNTFGEVNRYYNNNNNLN